ncbi:MAG: uL22 family ribosomal protein [Microgenomates group bacterium]|jgi:large subunit ribosomal protein L22|nr:50S ribosomal protein L22 [Candidatus Woesebacteria bacterium]MBP6882854.1 50S ribosomal protein L22 [Candidatus Woesebacteria bacterium]QQR63564.1 MAG: 50S ribosomal protein L22 [Candidatus Roizmanbacteria bacterium]
MSDFKVYIKNVKISPKKLRFLVSNVKKQSPVQAVHTLMYTQKKGATFLRKAISSALSNAKNTMNIDSGLLQFKSVAIEEGLRLKRFRAGSKGMAKPFRHEYSHIKLVLTTGDNTDKSIKSVKSIKSETEPVETEVKKTELKEVKSTKLKVKNATKEPKAEK